MKKILIFSNYAWTIYNFRLPLIKHLISQGFKLEILTRKDAFFDKLTQDSHIPCHELKLSRVGMNPIEELRSIWHIYLSIKKINPDVILTFTIKPNLYTGLLNLIFKKKVIANITGIGVISSTVIFPLVKLLYRIALAKVNTVFFQNEEDLNYFVTNRLVKKNKCFRIYGSGINLLKYVPNNTVTPDKKIFLMAARLIPQKGFYELMEASSLLHSKLNSNQSNWEIVIFGAMQEDRPESIQLYHVLKQSHDVTFHGYTDHIQSILKTVYFVVLPTYYNEGIPRILIEAIAMGKPIITTKQKGCMDCYHNNGYLVSPRDVHDLHNALVKAINLSNEDYKNFCENSRQLAVEKFDENCIFKAYTKQL